MKKIIILITVMLMILSVLSSCKKSSEVDQPGNPVSGIYIGNIASNFTEINSQGNEMIIRTRFPIPLPSLYFSCTNTLTTGSSI